MIITTIKYPLRELNIVKHARLNFLSILKLIDNSRIEYRQQQR